MQQKLRKKFLLQRYENLSSYKKKKIGLNFQVNLTLLNPILFGFKSLVSAFFGFNLFIYSIAYSC